VFFKIIIKLKDLKQIEQKEDKEGWIIPRRRTTIKPRKVFRREQKEEDEKMKNNKTSRVIRERIEQRKEWSTPKRQIENRPRRLVEFMSKNKETEHKGDKKRKTKRQQSYDRNRSAEKYIRVNVVKIDMEVLLLNSLILTVGKVEEVVEKFMKHRHM